MHTRVLALVLMVLTGTVVLIHRPAEAGGPVLEANVFVRSFGKTGSDDRAFDVAVTDDSVYFAGATNGSDFPVTAGAFDTLPNGDYDAVIMRLGRGGNLIWATLLGGPGLDAANGIDVDDDGNVYICGSTNNAAFPTTPGALRRQFSGASEGFVAKLSPDGSQLVYSTFIGGSAVDNAVRLRCGADGSVYVTGQTSSPNFPIVNASQPAIGGAEDAYLLQLDAAGATVLRSTFLGGSFGEAAGGLDVAADGTAWLSGFTSSTNFPVANPTQPAFGGGFTDGFVARYSPAGALEFATYLGGAGFDFGIGIAIDPSGRAHVAGTTDAMSFPTTPNADQTTGAGNLDGYYAVFDGTAMVYATILGGADVDQAGGIDATGDVIAVTGSCGPGFPATGSPVVKGASDGFIAWYSPVGERFETRLVGGTGDEIGRSVALDEDSIAAVAGGTTSSDLLSSRRVVDFEDLLAWFAEPVDSSPPVLKTDLLVDVRAVPREVNARPGGCFYIELRNQGQRSSFGIETVLVEITADPCSVTFASPRVAIEPVAGETSASTIRSGRFSILPGILRPGESILVEVCYELEEPCEPSSRVRCGAALKAQSDLRLENNYDSDELKASDRSPGKLLAWSFEIDGLTASCVEAYNTLPTSPPGRFDAYNPANIAGFRIYADSSPNVVPSPSTLSMEVSNGDARWVVLTDSDDYYRVVSVMTDGAEGPVSNEVGGPFPTITSVLGTNKRVTVVGDGFHSPLVFSLGGFPLIPPPKIRNGGTKVIQKLKFPIDGLNIGELLPDDASSSIFIDLGDENFLMFEY